MFQARDITVVITHIRPRKALLNRLMNSILDQTIQPSAIIISNDVEREGAARNRENGTKGVRSALVAFGDDDDSWKPWHLESLLNALNSTDADLVFPHFDVVNGTDPFGHWFGVPWEDDQLGRQIPVTFLARVQAIRDAGGWLTDWTTVAEAEDPGTDAEGGRAGEDYQLIRRMVANGAKIHHHPEISWTWDHGSGNTMGLPSRVQWEPPNPSTA